MNEPGPLGSMEPAMAAADETLLEAPGHDIRVLVVEDQLLLALEVEQTLEKAGYQVCARVPDGESAIIKARQLQPDLILMDIKLSGALDGVEAAKHIQQLSIPVIFLTAYADEHTVDRAVTANPYGYLVKPFSEPELRAAVQLALHRHEQDRGKTNGKADSASDFNDLFRTDLPEEKLDEAKYEILSELPFFKDIGRVMQQRLASSVSLARYRSRQVVVAEDEEEVRGFMVVSGLVALVKASHSGRELIVETIAPGDMLGFSMALAWKQYPVRIRALRDSQLVWFPREVVERLVKTYSTLPQLMLSHVSERLSNAYNIARSLAHDNVPVRVAATLLTKLASPQQDISGRQPYVPMTRQELADTIGTTLESAVRATRAMEEDGILDLSRRGRITVRDRKRLEALAGVDQQQAVES